VAAQVDDAARYFWIAITTKTARSTGSRSRRKPLSAPGINFGQMSQDVRVALPGFVKNANSLGRGQRGHGC